MTVYASLSSLLTVVRASTKSVWRDGVLTTISANTLPYEDKPLVDVPPGYAYNRGILVEESRINICTRSEDFTNAAWAKSAVTVSGNSTTAPDGTTTADSVIEDGATARHGIVRNSFAVTADTVKTWSIFVKPLPGSATRYPVLQITSGSITGAERVTVVFNLSTVSHAAAGILTTSATPTFIDADIESLPNGWFRIWMAASIGGGDAALGFALTFSTSAASANVSNSYAGDGASGFYVWGGQIEDGVNFASSYTPATAGSAVTRSADDISILMSSIPAGSGDDAGLVLRGITASGLSAGSQVFAQIDSGSEVDRIRLERDNLGEMRFIVTTGSVERCNLALGVVANNTRFGVAAAWAAHNFAASMNGGAIQTDTGGAIPGPTTLRLGRSFTGEYCNGHIERFAYRSDRPDNSILPRLSALT